MGSLNPVQKKLLVGLILLAMGVSGLYRFYVVEIDYLELILYVVFLLTLLLGIVITISAVIQKRKDGSTLWDIFSGMVWGLTKSWVIPVVGLFVTIAVWMDRDDSEGSEESEK